MEPFSPGGSYQFTRRAYVSSDDGNGYLIEKILPSKRVNLLAGISSAGKSRGFLPALVMWSVGLPVMGLKSHPVPWCVVCRDRPIQDAIDTITSMGFAEGDVTLIPAYGKDSKSRSLIMAEIEKCGAKFIFWEGFDLMVSNPNKASVVDEFLGEVTAYCQDGLTILGSVGVAKLKPYETYANPRQLVAGSSVWERSTSTNMILVPRCPGNLEDARRVLFVSLKNEPSFTLGGHFNGTGALEFDNWEDRLNGRMLEEALEDVRGKKRRVHP